jgi:anti-anti-sigma factor
MAGPDDPILRASVERSGETTKIAVAGELDLATMDHFAETVRAQLPAGPILLDLRGLSFMDSSGMRTLWKVVQEAGEAGQDIAIRDELQAGVRQVLELTGVLAELPFVPST